MSEILRNGYGAGKIMLNGVAYGKIVGSSVEEQPKTEADYGRYIISGECLMNKEGTIDVG